MGPGHRGEQSSAVALARSPNRLREVWIVGKPLHTLLAPMFADLGLKLMPAHVEGGVAMAAVITAIGARVLPILPAKQP